MKTVKIQVEMEVVIPIGYDILIKLDGDNSRLFLEEVYPPDIPPETTDRTVELAKELFTGLFGKGNAEIKKISDCGINFELHGSEEFIVKALLGELLLLEKAYFPSEVAGAAE